MKKKRRSRNKNKPRKMREKKAKTKNILKMKDIIMRRIFKRKNKLESPMQKKLKFALKLFLKNLPNYLIKKRDSNTQEIWM